MNARCTDHHSKTLLSIVVLLSFVIGLFGWMLAGAVNAHPSIDPVDKLIDSPLRDQVDIPVNRLLRNTWIQYRPPYLIVYEQAMGGKWLCFDIRKQDTILRALFSPNERRPALSAVRGQTEVTMESNRYSAWLTLFGPASDDCHDVVNNEPFCEWRVKNNIWATSGEGDAPIYRIGKSTKIGRAPKHAPCGEHNPNSKRSESFREFSNVKGEVGEAKCECVE